MSDRRLRVLAGTTGDGQEIAARLDRASIQVVLGPDASYERQVLIVCLADLLGRLFPRIRFVVADEACHPALPPGPITLVDRIADARLNGGFALLDIDAEAITVAVGPAAAGSADLYVDAFGWQTYLGVSPSKLPVTGSDLSAVGAVAAAARAAAIITQAILLGRPSDGESMFSTVEDTYASCLTYQTSAVPLEEVVPAIGELSTVLVGAGSVGGAAAYVFARTAQLNGLLVVVDPQSLELDNLDRALLATASAAEQGLPKVEVVRQALAHLDQLTVSPFQGDISSYHASLPREAALPLVLTAVDSPDARRAIQDCLPLQVINAACNPQEVMVSGHVTDNGPCVCCLQMRDVMDGGKTRAKLIAQATGFPLATVNQLLTQRVPLSEHHLRAIEAKLGVPTGSLNQYLGQTLNNLWRGQLLYGATPVETDSGAQVVVAAPYITALAGALLAGEALKASSSDPSHALGPDGRAARYIENPAGGPANCQLDTPERWAGSECLCRSTRRLRIMHERYGSPGVTI